MTMKRNTVEYNGRTVFVHDYAGLMLDEYAEAIRENMALAETEETTDRLVLIDQFNALFRQWLIGYLPSGYQMAWTSNGK